MGIKRGPCRLASTSRATFLAVFSAHVVRCFGVRRSSIHLLKGIFSLLSLSLFMFLSLSLSFSFSFSFSLFFVNLFIRLGTFC